MQASREGTCATRRCRDTLEALFLKTQLTVRRVSLGHIVCVFQRVFPEQGAGSAGELLDRLANATPPGEGVRLAQAIAAWAADALVDNLEARGPPESPAGLWTVSLDTKRVSRPSKSSRPLRFFATLDLTRKALVKPPQSLRPRRPHNKTL